VERLESRNDSLIQQAYAKDQALNDFLLGMNEIQYNLDSIKAKEMIINESTEGQVELRKHAKDQIIEDVNTIYNLLQENKDKLAELRKQLGKSNYQIRELEKMVVNMSKQLEQKDQEIAALIDMLDQMDVKIVALSQDVKRLDMNTAYYVVGTKKELKDANVITSEGGFIGIGKEKKLADDFSEEYFTKIDIREVTRIIAPGKKVEIVTTHPPDSYEIEDTDDQMTIVINDATSFWKSSKYLVVIVQ